MLKLLQLLLDLTLHFRVLIDHREHLLNLVLLLNLLLPAELFRHIGAINSLLRRHHHLLVGIERILVEVILRFTAEIVEAFMFELRTSLSNSMHAVIHNVFIVRVVYVRRWSADLLEALRALILLLLRGR